MKRVNISLRTGRILNFFLLALLIILIRVWLLTIVEYDQHVLESRNPQRRTVIERAERGTIRDRFGIPLATNRIQYTAAICYNDIRQIPSISWQKDPKGKRQRVFARRAFIKNFSEFLGKMLEIDPLDIEDTIHGKACLFPHTPFVLKEDISEELYCRLKIAEKDWPGIKVQAEAKRVYPRGKTACDVLGYLGSIGPREYAQVAHEMRELKKYLEEHFEGAPVFLPEGFTTVKEVQDRYDELQKKAYTINAQVGKGGIEASYEEGLRGEYGKKIYEVDIGGNVLRTLPGGKAAIPGKQINLSLSVELQEEAEKLLSEYEHLQDMRDQAGKQRRRTPWQRGGAIVAMDPNTGEVLALASYPRFNPNDLIPAQTFEKRKGNRSSIIKWLENESYLGEIWDGIRPLERELFAEGRYYTEKVPLTWELYLDTVLENKSSIRRCIDQIDTIEKAVHLDEELLASIPFQRDQHLLIDLLEMVVNKSCFTPSLMEKVGDESLSTLRLHSQIAASALHVLKEETHAEFHTTVFRKWREEHFTKFLKEKRKEEKAKNTYARPYSEYLEIQERKMFAEHWKHSRLDALYTYVMERSSDPLTEELKELLLRMEKSDRFAYLRALRPFEELNQPLHGKYPQLRSKGGVQLQKHLAAAFYPYSGYGYGRSQAYRQASPLGSIFKVIPAYAGLLHSHHLQKTDLNPLTITDDMQWTARPGSNSQVLGYFENKEPIKRFYKGGRLPRAYPKIGKIDLPHALERSSNIYFSLLAGDVLNSPSDLLNAAMQFGIGTKTGIALPDEYGGHLPDDILHNKTGLYSFAIGQHSLVGTPLQAATMLSAIASGGKLFTPQIVRDSQSETHLSNSLGNQNYPHKKALDLLGISFPLFNEKLMQKEGTTISKQTSPLKETIFMPEEAQKKLIEGMHLVTCGERGSARPAIMRSPFHDKEALKTYRKLAPQIVGKTGTAEILYKQTIDAETPAKMEKHVWFGAIGYEDETLKKPELVVIVYSRFGSAGRQGAPIAGQLIQKWREIKASH